MAEREHSIGRYRYALETGSGYGRLSLWNEHGEAVGEISFIEDERALHGPRLAVDLSSGAGFMPISRMLPLIDMLRNNSPVFLVLSDDPPGLLALRTTETVVSSPLRAIPSETV